MNGTENQLKQRTYDRYYPLDSSLYTLLISLGYNVSLSKGLAHISYGSRSITIKKEGDIWRELNTNKTFTFRSGIAIYAQRLKDCG
nr:MAG TPA: hypothetical protein [Bacteriophage sp.]